MNVDKQRAKVADTIKIVIGNGQPIPVMASGLHVTCPVCTQVHTIDVQEENSARSDVSSYDKHVKACLERTHVPPEGARSDREQDQS